MKKIILSVLMFGFAVGVQQSSARTPICSETEKSESSETFTSGNHAMFAVGDQRLAWWREAKFGMFIHFNASTVRGKSEWGMLFDKVKVADYKQQLSAFNPVQLNTDSIVRLAQEAGQKYIVYTTKHHDGCANFKSFDPFNVVDATAYGKDIVDQLVNSCRKYGMKFGFYYSQAQDWSHPGGGITSTSGGMWDAAAQSGDFDTYLKTLSLPQVKELCRRYPDVSILWWDTPVNMNTERAQLFKSFTDSLPNIIQCDRLGGNLNKDFKTPELNVPDDGYPGYDWESCMTMNNHWGYYEGDNKWKPATTLLHTLIDINSKGGNLLLNIGPDKNGVIPKPCVDALKAIGAWMRTNGESIYGTTLISPLTQKILPWEGRATGKTVDGVNRLYLHLFNYVAGSSLYVPIANEVTKAYLLAKPDNALSFSSKGTSVTVTMPDVAADSMSTVVVLEYKGTLAPSTDNTYTLKAACDTNLILNAQTVDSTSLKIVYADQLGNVIPGCRIKAEMISGDDYVKLDGPVSKITDAHGEVAFILKAGMFPGSGVVRLSTQSGQELLIRMTVKTSSDGCIELKGLSTVN